ncbi:MAG: septum formation initiator family protein [Acidobacteriota bacterium]
MAEPIRIADPPPTPRESLRSAGTRWLVTLVAIVLWLYALIGPEGIRVQFERRQKRDAMQSQLEIERSKTRALQDEVRLLKEDDTAIEKAIRGELDYQRDGEKVLLVPELPATETASPGGR